jgi:alpha-ketoglutarate-dependent taurine dioxygenase
MLMVSGAPVVAKEEPRTMPIADTIRVEPVAGATFGAYVTGVDLRALDDGAFAYVHDRWLEHKLLVFPGQHLTRDEQIAFARRFGELEFDLTELSNVRADGSVATDAKQDPILFVLKGNYFWHCDSTFLPVQARAGVLSAQVAAADGGETEWADLGAAYEALDPEMQAQVEGLSAHHSVVHSAAKAMARLTGSTDIGDFQPYLSYGLNVGPPPLRPLVKRHPETGQPSLNIGRHAYGVTGMGEAESDAFLEALTEFACQPPRTHAHKWAAGDLAVFDNRCLAHRVRPWPPEQPRVLFNTRIAGDPATEGALAELTPA